jgi:hypothetical protein
MITDVLIKNFKCFENLSIPQLQRVTLIGGRNNVGKTALLEALFLFLDRRSANMVVRQYGWRGIEGVRGDPQAMFGLIFRGLNLESEILVSATLNDVQEDAHFKFNPDYVPQSGPATTTPPPSQQISTDDSPISTFALDISYNRHDASKQQTSHLTIDPERGQLVLKIDYSDSILPKAIFLAAKKHTAPKETSEWFSDFVKESREFEIVDFLRIIEPRLEALKVVREGPGTFIHGKLKNLARTLDIHLMGEGMEKLLNIALAIAQAPGGWVFVDEFENGLHYSHLPMLWSAISQMLAKYDCQLFTTTHSHECIHAAHKGLTEMPSDFRYIRLDQSTGKIEAKLFNYEMLGDALKSGLEIR